MFLLSSAPQGVLDPPFLPPCPPIGFLGAESWFVNSLLWHKEDERSSYHVKDLYVSVTFHQIICVLFNVDE
jgi:hypothetical protein